MTSRRLFSAHSGVYSAVYEAVDTFSLRIGKRLYNVLAAFFYGQVNAIIRTCNPPVLRFLLRFRRGLSFFCHYVRSCLIR